MRFAASLAAVLCAFTVQPAGAHGIWTEERYGHLEVVYGHGAEDSAYDVDKVKGVWAYDKHGGLVPVTVKKFVDHVRLHPINSPAIVTVTVDNGIWSKDTSGITRNAPPSEVPGAVSASHSYKYNLAILKPHALVPKRLKMAMVIRPLTDPTQVGVGNQLPVEVLIDGKPAPNISLFGDYRGLPEAQSAVTDKQGRARITVRNSGLNIIAAQAKVPVTSGVISERSLFTSLSFVGEAHQH